MKLPPLKFTKLHGCGNSFIVATIRSVSEAELWRGRAADLCRPHFGVGADGILLPVLSDSGANPAALSIEVVMLNPDGSLMGMCGNGIRCVLRYLFLQGALPPTHTGAVRFLVEGRRITTQSSDGGVTVQVGMGAPKIISQEKPGTLTPAKIALPSGEQFEAVLVSMGNPHCVIFEQSTYSATELERLGAQIEHHPLFPNRTNVEFVQQNADGSLTVQVWERGAGATLACGTGACATLVAAVVTGRSGSKNSIVMPGGTLTVEWRGGDHEVVLTGPTALVFEGVLEPHL